MSHENDFQERLRTDLESIEWRTMLLTSGVLLFGFALGVAYLGFKTLGVLPPGDPSVDVIQPHYQAIVLASLTASGVALTAGFLLTRSGGEQP